MTITPHVIEKSAGVLVDIFGEAAPACARERMAEYGERSDKDGYRYWAAVAGAADLLVEQERAIAARRAASGRFRFPISIFARVLRGLT